MFACPTDRVRGVLTPTQSSKSPSPKSTKQPKAAKSG
jgi:hypothetical protein